MADLNKFGYRETESRPSDYVDGIMKDIGTISFDGSTTTLHLRTGKPNHIKLDLDLREAVFMGEILSRVRKTLKDSAAS